jgi:hypothetical protein
MSRCNAAKGPDWRIMLEKCFKFQTSPAPQSVNIVGWASFSAHAEAYDHAGKSIVKVAGIYGGSAWAR